MPYKAKGKCVYRKDTGKKVGCTKGSVKKYLGALHANVKENIFTKLYNDLLIEQTFLQPLHQAWSDETFQFAFKLYLSNHIQEGYQIDPQIQPMHQNIPHPTNGFIDIYQITLQDINKKNIGYTNNVIYQDVAYVLQNIKKTQNNDKLIKTLKKYSKQMLCTNKFIDDAKNMNLTGRMGHKAKLVMDFILSSTIKSLSRNKSKICGFVYMIDKKEENRISLYDDLISKFLNYQNRFIDMESNSRTISIYYIR